MSLNCLLFLGEGTTFHRFRKNPFRPAKPGPSPVLVSVKPISTQPIQPALHVLQQAGEYHAAGRARTPLRAGDGSASGSFTSICSTPATHARQSAEAGSPQLLRRTEKVEVLVLKLIVIILALAGIGCGFGIQHIAYVRQKNALCRQLRQKEVELLTVTQAYRSLEYCVAAKAADDFRRVEAGPVIAKTTARKVPTRG